MSRLPVRFFLGCARLPLLSVDCWILIFSYNSANSSFRRTSCVPKISLSLITWAKRQEGRKDTGLGEKRRFIRELQLGCAKSWKPRTIQGRNVTISTGSPQHSDGGLTRFHVLGSWCKNTRYQTWRVRKIYDTTDGSVYWHFDSWFLVRNVNETNKHVFFYGRRNFSLTVVTTMCTLTQVKPNQWLVPQIHTATRASHDTEKTAVSSLRRGLVRNF